MHEVVVESDAKDIIIEALTNNSLGYIVLYTKYILNEVLVASIN